jgi:hypothetical protein
MLPIFLSAFCFAAPSAHPSEDGSLLVLEEDGVERIYDFASQIHRPDNEGSVSDLALRMTDAAVTPSGDRVVSSWAVRAERPGDDGVLWGWIGVLEPGRTRLAGFPVYGVPTRVSVSDDGEVVTWSDAEGAHVRTIAPPPRPRIVLPPDEDPPLFEVDPVLWGEIDIVDWGFGGPDIALEVFDLIDWIEPIGEEPDEVILEPGEVFWGERPERGPGAQRIVSPVMDLPLPPGEGEVVATLGVRGRALAVARGNEVAVWTVGSHVREPMWTGSLSDRIVKLTLLEEQASQAAARATLASGEVVDLELDAPWVRREPDALSQ